MLLCVNVVLLRRNAHGAGLGRVSSNGDGRVESSSGRVSDVHTSTSRWRHPPQPHPQHHERFRSTQTSQHKARQTRNIKDLIGSFTGYDLKPAALSAEQKTLTYHHYVEAFKFANGLKKHIRDPKFSSEDVSASSETLWLNTSVLF